MGLSVTLGPSHYPRPDLKRSTLTRPRSPSSCLPEFQGFPKATSIICCCSRPHFFQGFPKASSIICCFYWPPFQLSAAFAGNPPSLSPCAGYHLVCLWKILLVSRIQTLQEDDNQLLMAWLLMHRAFGAFKRLPRS